MSDFGLLSTTTPNYERTVLVQGLALASASYFKVDQVRLDAFPDKNVSTTELAETDGEYVLGQKFGSKPVYLKGHFEAPQRWDYEKGRDELAYLLNVNRKVVIQTEQSGEQRRFDGLYENVRFDYKERGFVMVEIDFRITGAFGETVQVDKPIDNVGYTSQFDGTFNVGGSAETLPLLTLGVNSITPADEPVTMSFVFNSNNVRNRVEVKRIWEENDTLTMDSKKKEVRVNGEMVEYSGMLPRFLGNTQVTILDYGTARDCYVTIEYNKRWL